MSLTKFMELVRRRCQFKWLLRSGSVPEDIKGISVAEAYQQGFRKGYWGGVEDGVAVSTDVGLVGLPVQRNEFVN